MTAVRRRKSLAAVFCAQKKKIPLSARCSCGQGKGHTAMRCERNCAADWHSPSSTSLDAVSSFSLMNATQPLTSPSVMTGTAVTRR